MDFWSDINLLRKTTEINSLIQAAVAALDGRRRQGIVDSIRLEENALPYIGDFRRQFRPPVIAKRWSACPVMDYRADQRTRLGITNLFAEELSDGQAGCSCQSQNKRFRCCSLRPWQ